MINVLYLAPAPEDTNAVQLVNSGFEVTTVNSVEECIEMAASSGPFRFLVADAGIIEPDPGALVSGIKSVDPTILVVIYSINAITEEFQISVIKQGADYCLPDLIEGSLLLPTILETLAEKKITETLPIVEDSADVENEETRQQVTRLVADLKKARDIIEKQLLLMKKSESEYRKQEERLNFILNITKTGIWDIDLESGNKYFSNEWFYMLGLRREDTPDPESAWEAMLYSDDMEEIIADYQSFIDGHEGEFSADYRINCPDGRVIWLSDAAVAFSRDESGRPSRVIRAHVNIDRLKNAYGYLKEANKKMNMMSSIIRHDALNQVTGMMIFMDMLKELAEEDEELKKYVDQIDRGMTSIHDKLVFTRDYHGLGEYGPEWQDIAGIINDLMLEIEMEGISIELELDGLEIYSDPLLRMAFIRLIENTVKHGEKATRIRLSYQMSDGECMLVLEDDGVGIPTDEKSQIFRNGYGKHAGYGLFLVQQLLSITGISIEETGREGEGARFEMLVPEGMYRLKKAGGEE